MAYSFFIVLTIPLLVTTILSSAESVKQRCTKNQYCVCDKKDNLQCNATIHIVFEWKKTFISCNEYMSNVSWTDLLVGLNLGERNNKILIIKNCPVPKISFYQFFLSTKLLDVVSNLEFQSFQSTNLSEPEIQLQPYHFDNLTNIEQLSLTNKSLTRIASDVFRGLTKLKLLTLEVDEISLSDENALAIPSLEKLYIRCNLAILGLTILANCTKLQRLIANSNKLGNSLSRRDFRNIRKLQMLDISHNNITELAADIFEDLPFLEELNLNLNNISSLPAASIFSKNVILQKIRLSLNDQPLSLPSRSFAGLPSLTELTLKKDNLTALPNDLLWESRNLSVLELTGNNLKWLPEDLFRDAKSLTKLSIDQNELTDLNDTLFHPLVKLKNLKLDNNRLKTINVIVFFTLNSINSLNLSNNKLEKIDQKAFDQMGKLRCIDMSNNALVTITENDLPIFDNCSNLEEIIMSKNRMSIIPKKWISLVHLNNLKLDHNNFTEYKNFRFASSNLTISVTDNNISTVNIETMEHKATILCKTENDCKGVKIILDRNPLNCDCESYHFARYVQGNMSKAAYKYVTLESILCSKPNRLKGMQLKDVDLKTITCPLNECPAGCKCDVRAFDNAAIVNCSNAQLNKVPSWLSYKPRFSHIEVMLDNNKITSLSSMTNSVVYKNVTKFILSHNEIDRIDTSQFSTKLKVLNLDNNQFTHLDNNTLTSLHEFQYLQNLTLHGNPWKCNCDTDTPSFRNYLRSHINQVSHLGNITCEGGGQRIADLSVDDLCPIFHYIFIAGIVLATFSLIFGVLVALYYRYRHEIRVWLFTHKLCLWFVTEKEIDKHKKYDAFISYSHMDENFVVKYLVDGLEKDVPRPFKLCLHYRDWLPGELISNQIVESVENSRRTIVVLSPNFLNSVWAKMEFRTAHLKAMKEGCARVIVILYDDVDTKKLDPELKLYITTNVYLKWGDPWFWNKLRYALPHPPEYYKQQPVKLSLLSNRRRSGKSKSLVAYARSYIVPMITKSSSEQEEKISQLNELCG